MREHQWNKKNKHRVPATYQEGDWVLVHHSRLPAWPRSTSDDPYFEPYKILSVDGHRITVRCSSRLGGTLVCAAHHLKRYYDSKDLCVEEWELNDEEIAALDLQGAASPMEVEGELPDMNAEEMAKEGFYLVKYVLRHRYRRGWRSLTLCEGFDTRIDLLLLSQPLIATPALHVLEAHIIQHDVSSDHHPISASIELPFTPAHPLPQPHTLFRRLNQSEELEFLKSIQQLEQWAYEVTRVQVSPHRLVQFINSVVPQLARAFHQITRPCNPHRETPIEREFKEWLPQLPKGHAQRTRALRRLQELSESWRARQSKREKKNCIMPW